MQAGGAISSLGFLSGSYDWTAHPDIPGRIKHAILDAVPHLRALKDAAVLNALASFLGSVKTDHARNLLWEIAGTPSARGQALIALCRIADPRDLPRLGNMLLTRGPAAYSLSYEIHRAYGEKAVPYLQKAKTEAPDKAVRDACARELAQREKPAANRT
jgi:hypothetical protein